MKQTSGAEIKKALKKVEVSLPATRDSLIPALQAVQEKLGWLPAEAILAISKFLRVPESQVWGAASFYAQFRFTPAGKNILTVCRGTACHVRGSQGILRDLERELGVKAGETTPDMNFTVQQVACFGSCALAPVLVVNHKVYGRQTSASMKKTLNHLKKSAATKGNRKKTQRLSGG